jgi:hypothetical protein
MMINFYEKYNSATQNVETQKIYINYGKALNFKRTETPNPSTLSEENFINELFKFGDSSVSN